MSGEPKLYCPSCGDWMPFAVRKELETYPVNGVDTQIEAKVSYCKKCGRQLWNEQDDSENLKAAFKAAGLSV